MHALSREAEQLRACARKCGAKRGRTQEWQMEGMKRAKPMKDASDVDEQRACGAETAPLPGASHGDGHVHIRAGRGELQAAKDTVERGGGAECGRRAGKRRRSRHREGFWVKKRVREEKRGERIAKRSRFWGKAARRGSEQDGIKTEKV
eukprot:1487797-Pleurochrysis_carterae.AAC.2